MKVVCLIGSPRVGGNTDLLADEFLHTAQDLKAEVKKYYLNQLSYRGCQACMGCKKVKETCVLKDDLSQVLEDVKTCDIALFCTPVYYGDITSQMKAFIDRTYCYLTPDYITDIAHASRLSKGKKLVFVMAQGHPDPEQFKDIYPRYEFFLKWYGFDDRHLLRAVGVGNKGDVKSHSIMSEAKELAQKLIK